MVRPTTEEPSMVEMGTTGTGIFGSGYIRELGEYNSDFSGGPFTAYRTYEQMRRGDAQVAATVMAMKLPVRCAEWAVRPPKDATPAEKECAEFVEGCLFDDLDFDRTLENLLLALDFGAGCHEDIWTVTNGQIRLKKLAARMPLTFYTWTVDGEENLVELVQHGFHGGAFSTYTLPADKIALYTFRQEGSNFAGRAILREMYQHWYTKAALYKIDAIACERNGMGVPTGTLGPDAKKEDRAAFEEFLSSVAAHQSAYVMMPAGYLFELKGVVGQVRDCKESITHHNMQISMAALNQFLVMGQSHGGGNRSLGETMSDFFFLSLQTLANQVGDAYSDNTIARLAAYNYGPNVRPPRLVPQRLIAMKFESVVDALNKLGLAGCITMDPDLEVWVREGMGAPAIDKATILKMKQAAISVPAVAPPANGDKPTKPEADAGTGASPAGGGSPTEKPVLVKKAAASGAGGDGKVTASVEYWAGAAGRMGRAPRGVETCMALADIVNALDKGRDEVASALRAARPAIQAGIIHKVLNRPVGQMHRASVEPDQALVAVVAEILGGVAEFGRGQVALERAKQHSGAAPADAGKIRAAAARSKDPIGLYADGVVSEFTNTLSARATNAAIDWKRRGVSDGQAIQGVQADLDEQSDKWIDGVGSKGANEAFAEGRDAGYAEYKDEIGSVIYSAMLDLNCCEACVAADGQEGATPEDVPDVPNPDCDGGDKCRCVHVYVFADEVASKK
jgi:phage gp29-like protein